MREPAFRRGGMLWTYRLMIANAVIHFGLAFLAFWGFMDVRPGAFLPRVVEDYLALSAEGLAHGFVWQLVTFQFLHGGMLHLLLNLVVIFFFGRAIEDALGARRMLQLYFLSGVVGGFCQVLLGVALPRLFGGGVVGASAGAFGLVAAFATLFPDRVITLLLFFVIPVSMRARTLLWLSVLLGLLGLLIPGDGVAHAAHLGGVVAAVWFVRVVLTGRFRMPSLRMPARPRRRPRVAVMSRGTSDQELADSLRASSLPPNDLPADFMAQEVDPILDKISAHGIQSLTERERRILEVARSRMRR
jgi:membrane associated rhomboid family serine protease